MAKQDLCPCGSGARYRECCAPYHRGERTPADAPRLMRARFAAFAMKELPFLRRTLHASHPDAQRPEGEVLRELRQATSTYRYVRLHVLDSRPPNDLGVAQVLFHAEIFERGKDRSFIELSEFELEGGEWRYARGELLPASVFAAPQTLQIPQFQAQLSASVQ